MNPNAHAAARLPVRVRMSPDASMVIFSKRMRRLAIGSVERASSKLFRETDGAFPPTRTNAAAVPVCLYFVQPRVPKVETRVGIAAISIRDTREYPRRRPTITLRKWFLRPLTLLAMRDGCNHLACEVLRIAYRLSARSAAWRRAITDNAKVCRLRPKFKIKF